MWIEGQDGTLLNLDEVLCFEIQQETKGSNYEKKLAGKHRSEYGNAEITMFIGEHYECAKRIQELKRLTKTIVSIA